jgi:hypothetical protein
VSDDIEDLAQLLRQRNLIDADIAKIIRRPALSGHVGEFIAAEIFGIDLHDSAVTAASDGVFRDPPLAGKTVNVKLYGKVEGMLDLPIPGKAMADYTLVLTGPSAAAASSKGTTRPLVITAVYLFRTAELVAKLQAKGLKIGVASSVKKSLWDAAEIYPSSGPLVLNDDQRDLLALFAPVSQLP